MTDIMTKSDCYSVAYASRKIVAMAHNKKGHAACFPI